MSDIRLGRATDTASYAQRLRIELVHVTVLLDRYRGSPGLELMRDQSLTTQLKLGALAGRLRAPDGTTNPGRHLLTGPEQLSLENARALRDRLIESLSRYERAEKLAGESDTDERPPIATPIRR